MTNGTNIVARLRNPGLAALALLCALRAVAQEPPLYQVEVVVFRHTQPAAAGEMWNRPLAPYSEQGDTSGNAGDVVDEEPALTAETVPTGRFELLSAEDFKLGDTVAKLSRASRFSPILHTGWIQPGLALEESRAKNVSGRDRKSSVSGRIVLYRGRYTHLDFDLKLATATGDYRLRQSRRRIQTNRYHYIDHPMFSAIALVTKVPVKEVPVEDEPVEEDPVGENSVEMDTIETVPVETPDTD